ncbi:hypothetical protein LDENG_00164370 [Lucifuga dentata]|nr:hypothetical protein LDENG_00164370 [Lucifuga dentata]
MNGLYPCRDWNDDIAPLINKKNFASLLSRDADTNKASADCLTPLHYVSVSKAPVVFVRKLLEARANPDGIISVLTPLHFAAFHDRDDVMKELNPAAALISVLPIHNPDHDIQNLKKIAKKVGKDKLLYAANK